MWCKEGRQGDGYLIYCACRSRSGQGNIACTIYECGRRYWLDAEVPNEFVPLPPDVIVASGGCAADGGVYQRRPSATAHRARFGYASRALAPEAGLAGASARPGRFTVTGTGFRAWECGEASAATCRCGGVRAQDELHQARGPSPACGPGGACVREPGHRGP